MFDVAEADRPVKIDLAIGVRRYLPGRCGAWRARYGGLPALTGDAVVGAEGRARVHQVEGGSDGRPG